MFSTIINTRALNELLKQENTLVVDCRFKLADTNYGRDAYAKAHIPKSIYAHLDDDLSGEIIPNKTGRHPLPDIITCSNRFSKWGIDADTQVVVYDDKSGAIAARLWWMLQWLGHKKVAVLDGGWQAWQAAELPTTTDFHQPNVKKFIAKANLSLVVDVEYVQQKINGPDFLLIDSRATKRYTGEHEPIDPIAGHIPSAISAPFAENIDTNKHLLSETALKDRFEKLLGDATVEQTVFYCGSGVTACYNLLALRHAGLGMAKLYPGSWSDWIVHHANDPSLKDCT